MSKAIRAPGLAGLTRRRLVTSAGAGLLAAVSSKPLAAAAWIEETPSQPIGPFYAPFKPLSIDNDLLFLPGRTEPAEGRVIEVAGRVMDQRSRPLAGARVEIFQANTFGRYNHPNHANSNLKLDPNFQGFGHDLTDAEGRYRFRTIKPGPYPDSPDWIRPPHIHFIVFPARGENWATQMYFVAEELNRKDLLLNQIEPRLHHLVMRPIIGPPVGAPGGKEYVDFDIVLGQPGVERLPT